MYTYGMNKVTLLIVVALALVVVGGAVWFGFISF